MILAELKSEAPNFEACSEVTEDTCLETVFAAASVAESLPSYWKHFIIDVSMLYLYLHDAA